LFDLPGHGNTFRRLFRPSLRIHRHSSHTPFLVVFKIKSMSILYEIYDKYVIKA
jgi:hypothetical protein